MARRRPPYARAIVALIVLCFLQSTICQEPTFESPEPVDYDLREFARKLYDAMRIELQKLSPATESSSLQPSASASSVRTETHTPLQDQGRRLERIDSESETVALVGPTMNAPDPDSEDSNFENQEDVMEKLERNNLSASQISGSGFAVTDLNSDQLSNFESASLGPSSSPFSGLPFSSLPFSQTPLAQESSSPSESESLESELPPTPSGDLPSESMPAASESFLGPSGSGSALVSQFSPSGMLASQISATPMMSSILASGTPLVSFSAALSDASPPPASASDMPLFSESASESKVATDSPRVTESQSSSPSPSHSVSHAQTSASVIRSSPTIRELIPRTGSVGGGTRLRLQGENFCKSGMRVFLGKQQCRKVTVESSQVAFCHTPEGKDGEIKRIRLECPGTKVTPSAHTFKYHGPVVSSVHHSQNSTSGGYRINIQGRYFTSLRKETVHAFIGRFKCESLRITSDREASCFVPAACGSALPVSVRIRDEKYYTTAVFSYAAVSISKVEPQIGSIRGGDTVTVYGSNFSGSNLCKKRVLVDIGEVQEESIVTIDSEKIVFKSPAGSSVGFKCDLKIFQENQGSSLLGAWIYLPVVDSVSKTHGSYAGGNSVLLQGDFGSIINEANVQIGPYLCTLRGVPTKDSIWCVTSPGRETNIPFRVLVNKVGAIMSIPSWSYLPPAVINIEPSHGTIRGGTEVQITGENIATLSESAPLQVFIGGRNCSVTKRSENYIKCTTPPGIGSGNDVSIDLTGEKFNRLAFWNYTSPSIISITPQSSTLVGRSYITLTGNEFGLSRKQQEVMIGGKPCLRTVFISDTIVHCLLPPWKQGHSTARISAMVGNQQTERDQVFQFIDTGIQEMEPNMGPTTGGTSIKFVSRFLTADTYRAAIVHGRRGNRKTTFQVKKVGLSTYEGTLPIERYAVGSGKITIDYENGLLGPEDFHFYDATSLVKSASPQLLPYKSTEALTFDGISYLDRGLTVVKFGSQVFPLEEWESYETAISIPYVKRPGSWEIQISPNSQQFINTGISVIFQKPPPQIDSIIYSGLHSRIDVNFNIDTNMGGFVPFLSQCKEFFTPDSLKIIGPKSECVWSSYRTLSVWPSASVESGSILEIKNNTIFERGADNMNRQALPFSWGSDLLKSPSLSKDPVVVLMGLDHSSACDDITFDATGSYGLRGSTLTYKWSLTEPSYETLKVYVDTQSADQLVISSSFLERAASQSKTFYVTVQVQATDSSGRKSTPSRFTTKISTDYNFSSGIVGPKEIEMNPLEDFYLQSGIVHSSCKPSGPVRYEWRLENEDGSVNPANLLSHSQLMSKDLHVPGSVLASLEGRILRITFEAHQEDGIIQRSQVRTKVRSKKGAYIQGCNTTKGNQSNFTLVVNTVGFENTDALVSYHWKCTLYDNEPCGFEYNSVTTSASNNIRAQKFPLERAMFHVMVRGPQDSVETSCFVDFVNKSSIPLLEIENHFVSQKTSWRPTLIAASATNIEKDGVLYWTMLTPGLNLTDLTISAIQAQDSLILRPQNRVAPLYPYEIALATMVDGLEIKSVQVLQFRKPPFGGHLEVEPQSGYALETEFRIQAKNWFDDESQGSLLQYQFSVVDEMGKADEFILSPKSFSSSISTMLPLSATVDGNVTIRVRIYNTDGEFSIFDRVVKVFDQEDIGEKVASVLEREYERSKILQDWWRMSAIASNIFLTQGRLRSGDGTQPTTQGLIVKLLDEIVMFAEKYQFNIVGTLSRTFYLGLQQVKIIDGKRLQTYLDFQEKLSQSLVDHKFIYRHERVEITQVLLAIAGYLDQIQEVNMAKSAASESSKSIRDNIRKSLAALNSDDLECGFPPEQFKNDRFSVSFGKNSLQGLQNHPTSTFQIGAQNTRDSIIATIGNIVTTGDLCYGAYLLAIHDSPTSYLPEVSFKGRSISNVTAFEIIHPSLATFATEPISTEDYSIRIQVPTSEISQKESSICLSLESEASSWNSNSCKPVRQNQDSVVCECKKLETYSVSAVRRGSSGSDDFPLYGTILIVTIGSLMLAAAIIGFVQYRRRKLDQNMEDSGSMPYYDPRSPHGQDWVINVQSNHPQAMQPQIQPIEQDPAQHIVP